MFCKHWRNHRQEQVGEDFIGNQPDQLSSFIGLHWTARLIKRVSVKSKHTPSSLHAATPSADFNYKSPGNHNQPPTSNIKELRLKLRITQVVYLQSASIKMHTICRWALIDGLSPTLQLTCKFTDNQRITDTDICIFVCIFVHICAYMHHSFHRCYTRFGAYPNYMNVCKNNL
jgi:hypothetical protein